MFKNNILFVAGIFFLIINISFVLSATYRINDNIHPQEVIITDDLQWEVIFYTEGGPLGGVEPSLEITDSDFNLITIFAKANWVDDWAQDHCGVDLVDGWSNFCNVYTWDYVYFPVNDYGFNSIKQSVLPETYTFNMKSYGNGMISETLYDISLDQWGNQYTCDDSCRRANIGSCFGVYAEYVVIDDCYNPPLDGTACDDYDDVYGWQCNGVRAEIAFYDGNNPVPEIVLNTDDWDTGFYGRDFIFWGEKWLTDTTPGPLIEFEETIDICMDECVLGDSGCNLAGNATWICVDNTPTGGCYEKIETICDEDVWLDTYRCNPNAGFENEIQKQKREYSCDTNNCVYDEDNWYDTGTLCLGNDVCFNPAAGDNCCEKQCSGAAECGGDNCGGFCGGGDGTCTAPRVCDTDSKQCILSGDAYWANMNGEFISGDNGAQIGDTVLLIYKNKEGESHNFTIYEDNDYLGNVDGLIVVADTFDYNGHLAASWVITPGIYNTWRDGSVAEFHFEVNVGSNLKSSVDLNINGDVGVDLNSKPSVMIIEPGIRSKVMVGNELNFTQFAKDEDDDLQIKWVFEDGVESGWMLNCLTNLTNNNCNITHAYASSGTKIIEIIVKEMGRGQEAVNNSQVFAYDEGTYTQGVNVFADILTPPFGKIYPNPGASAAQLIPFNASTTYVAYCDENRPPCEIFADDYEGVDVTDYCLDLGNLSNTLWCYDIPSLKDNKAKGEHKFSFDWTFSENVGRSGEWTGVGVDDYNEVVEFERMFFAPIQHWAKLIINYIDLS